MSVDRLAELTSCGVSLWLDDLSRHRITSGNLATLIADQHISGVTTNPTIFAKALAGTDDYAAQLAELAAAGADAETAVTALTTTDVAAAADILAPVAARTAGADGRVSIEVDPRLARDTDATIVQARALWAAINRPNLHIKIPATVEGLPAITAAIAEGICVNVTLIFSVQRYAEVIDAYLAGLTRARAAGRDLSAIHSVASVFISRVDTEVDRQLDTIGSSETAALRGQAGIANARLCYALYEEKFSGPIWEELAAAGANKQRPLWASTGVKDPQLDDTRYLVELVAPGTVNTAPEATINAVADHGQIRGDTVTGTGAAASATLSALQAMGVDLVSVFARLEQQGLDTFVASWMDLLETVQDALEAAAN